MIYCIDVVYTENETCFRDWFDWVRSMMKIRHDNDVTNRIGLIYVETENELSGPNYLAAVCDENQTR